MTRTDGDAMIGALDELVGGARRSVSLTLTAAGEFVGLATAALTRLAAHGASGSVRPGADPSAEGAVVVRVLCSGAATDAALAVARRLPGLRVEVRVSEAELREALLVDGRGALVRSTSQDCGGHAVQIKDPAVVRALDLLVAGAWSRARPLLDHLGLSPKLCKEPTRRILEMLREGHTDEAAAQELNVSLRTYRRHVAEIMRELGATSRFQAGVRAVELGLLSANG
ncbi:helix-turn-helix transcriptional regulator [Kitasatospora sp. NBC_00085]|uniref:response regulator transcription factor n=1 Tax=unclassified Kitasatospora TaxID=2633591 RepID=UPI00324D0A48